MLVTKRSVLKAALFILIGMTGLPNVVNAKVQLEPLGEVPVPADNKQTPEKIELGKILFYDGRLSGDTTSPCAGCHIQSQGWGFPDDLSMGYPGTVHWRNSQTIINAAYYDKFFWAGSAMSLEAQAKDAAKGAVAGNGEDDIMEARLALVPEYVERFKRVFGDDTPKIHNAWRAIAAFERTMIQRDTPIDNYLLGDKTALSESQLKGKALFEGKANCIACHNGALASDQKFYNIGVPPSPWWNDDGLAQITFRFELYSKGVTEEMYRTTKADPGAYFRAKRKEMLGKFRTPSLRYTKYTAPYMHNGTIPTLEAVIDFYDRGGVADDGRTTGYPQTKSALIQPLGLTEQDKKNLLSFVEAFSGEQIFIEEPTIPEYQPLFTKEELAGAEK
ncbi:cytochrome c peroxidase [Vibrio splendidus]|jgi:cytochrome c peroxidase|uniref:cytochrome-c peroxidase n=1 Tax=Vibrio splendidus TaxID=29497 RepID=UPI000C81E6A1|nr:cytochrome c peroxidase [Vibrio splendidus]MBT9241198.1 cytochrome-c peroxidase [Vibrio splendidus]MDH5931812.1 cytochrome-c peroxidase [Vibrio splendidus]MDP2614583.1 cytochrome c peroxidase [Vibrio splendidus]PMK40938.1 cytochrome-c peroxidase [Vibrio splendidus]PMO99148.1 cytochrome-c peroxidase [Vibrio splendidus]